MYDKVALALHGDMAQTNYPVHLYDMKEIAELEKMKVNREVLQKRLGVKPMDKSSKYVCVGGCFFWGGRVVFEICVL